MTHRIWIGTNRGLYILDKQSYVISAILLEDLEDKAIDNMHIASDGSIWISSPQRYFGLTRMEK